MRTLCALALLLTLGACKAEGPRVDLAGQSYRVRIAADDESRALGLMYRKHMPADEGMLFLFREPQALAFWMKNTLIPLDILYFDASGKLVSMVQNAQPCGRGPCPGLPSTAPAKFVLELNAGQSKLHGFKIGDHFRARLGDGYQGYALPPTQ